MIDYYVLIDKVYLLTYGWSMWIVGFLTGIVCGFVIFKGLKWMMKSKNKLKN